VWPKHGNELTTKKQFNLTAATVSSRPTCPMITTTRSKNKNISKNSSTNRTATSTA